MFDQIEEIGIAKRKTLIEIKKKPARNRKENKEMGLKRELNPIRRLKRQKDMRKDEKQK